MHNTKVIKLFFLIKIMITTNTQTHNSSTQELLTQIVLIEKKKIKIKK